MPAYVTEQKWAFYVQPDAKGYDKHELAKIVFDKQARLENDSVHMLTNRSCYHALYTDTKPVMYQNDYGSAFLTNNSFNKHAGLTLNVVASCVDALASMVAENKPRIRYVTDEGNDRMKDKARKMTYFNDGVFHFNDIYKLSRSTWKQAAVYGDGCAVVFWDDAEKRVKVEHQNVNDVFVDQLDGIYGRPWETFRRKSVSKSELIIRYPELKEQIESAQKISPTGFIANAIFTSTTEANDAIKVVECWRRPSSRNKKDGRHVITISNVVLLDEPWNCSLPIKFFKYDRPLEGFWGVGLTEKLSSIQLELNTYMAVICDSLLLGAIPKLYVHQQTTVSPEVYTNTPMAEVKWSGRVEPAIKVPGVVVPGEFYAFLWQMYDKAFQIAGISKMMAVGEKPGSFETGAAMREFKQVTNERFASMQADFDDWFVELAQCAWEVAVENYTNASNVKIFAGSCVDEIKWGDVSMNEQDFVIKKWVTSNLPKEPAGMIQYISEKAQNGTLTKMELEELMDMPDLGNDIRLKTAPIRAVMNQVYQMIDEHIYEPPEEQMDVKLAKQYALGEYNDQLSKPRGERNADAMELLLQYIEQCDQILMKVQGVEEMMQQAQAASQAPANSLEAGAGSVQARPLV